MSLTLATYLEQHSAILTINNGRASINAEHIPVLKEFLRNHCFGKTLIAEKTNNPYIVVDGIYRLTALDMPEYDELIQVKNQKDETITIDLTTFINAFANTPLE